MMQLGCINKNLLGGPMSQTRIKIRKDQKSAQNRRRTAKYWMAVGTMAAYTTFGSDAVFKVYAQQDRSTPPANVSGQTQGLTVRLELWIRCWRLSRRLRNSA